MPPDCTSEAEPLQGAGGHEILRDEGQRLARGVEEREIPRQLRTLSIGRGSSALEEVIEQGGSDRAEEDESAKIHQKRSMPERITSGLPWVVFLRRIKPGAVVRHLASERQPGAHVQHSQQDQQGFYSEQGSAPFREQTAANASGGSRACDPTELALGFPWIENLVGHAPEAAEQNRP